MITERQQFHLEQLKAAEFRARQQAHQRLQQEQGQWAPNPNLPPGAAAVVPPTTISAQGVTSGPVIPPTNSTETNPAPVLAVASPLIPPPSSTVPLPPTGQPVV